MVDQQNTTPTELTYVQGRPAELRLRRFRLIYPSADKTVERRFGRAVVRIGSATDNDVVLDADGVSRYHCKIVEDAHGYLVVDQGSTNGTYIDHLRVREAFLTAGCTIYLGKAQIAFEFDEERVAVVPSPHDRLGDLVGGSVPMRELYTLIEKIAPAAATVIVDGETGTGKELVARSLHALSGRPGALLTFDCSAVSPTLIESELFGHEKGSFTGAVTTRRGALELAQGGTLFLDEIGELPLDLQPKLLRALEQREIRRVGGSDLVKVDVRVVAATNRDLELEVQEGRFRRDLFYRLSVVRLSIPPLRERRADISAIVAHLLATARFNRLADGSQRATAVDEEAMQRLIRFNWPGNVRQLVNALEQAVSLADGALVRAADLPEELRAAELAADTLPSGHVDPDAPFSEAKEQWVAKFERDYVVALLKKARGNISEAARIASVDRKHFRKLMRKHHISPEIYAEDT
ncbi:MAG: sigma 54-interacting transcriptional regulator [Deltaproteobacteria bacterium]|nr:sigma 54-interacting transcriptional regulator [Deltaproteobacteria bacterium]